MSYRVRVGVELESSLSQIYACIATDPVVRCVKILQIDNIRWALNPSVVNLSNFDVIISVLIRGRLNVLI